MLDGGGGKPAPILVEDPTTYLDKLLYQAMRAGPNLTIPWEAVMGCANGGKGFLAADGELRTLIICLTSSLR